MSKYKKNIFIRIYSKIEWVVRISITLFIFISVLSIGIGIFIGIIIGGKDKKDVLDLDDFFSSIKESSHPNVLIFDPKGMMKEIYEEPTNNFFDIRLLLKKIEGIVPYSVRENNISLQKFTGALYKASKDKHIKAALIYFKDVAFDTLVTQKEAMNALRAFRSAGKKIIAFDDIDMSSYMVSSVADVFVVDELDPIFLTGMKAGHLYLKDFYDKIKLNVEIFHKGKYKSAPEKYYRNSLSKYARENLIEIVDGDWKQFLSFSAENRNIDPSKITGFIQKYNELLHNKKIISYEARDRGLVTHIYKGGISEEKYLIKLLSDELKEDKKKFKYQSYQNYIGNDYFSSDSRFNVAVVALEGEIEEGFSTEKGFSTNAIMGSLSVVPFLEHRFSNNSKIKAMVLRINSPGGDALAAQKIRRELLFLKETLNIPIVVSMGRVAASGGYLISTAADSVVADPFTITGSIGVYQIVFNYSNLLDFLGMYWDGYSTAWLADFGNNNIPLTEKMRDLRAIGAENMYKVFLEYVAKARNMDIEKADTIAQGKVYTASGALKVNLIDKIGTLQDAIEIAAEKAHLDDIKVAYFVPPTKEVKDVDFTNFIGSFIKRISKNIMRVFLSEKNGTYLY